MDSELRPQQHHSIGNPHFSGIGLVGGLIGVLVLHCSLFFILYRGGAVNHWFISKSEFLVLYLPPLLALASYGYLFSRAGLFNGGSPSARAMRIFVVSFAMAFISMLCSFILPFNLYGT